MRRGLKKLGLKLYYGLEMKIAEALFNVAKAHHPVVVQVERCRGCPFFHFDSLGDPMCEQGIEPLYGNEPPPKECPLRTYPFVVEMAPNR